MKTIGIDIDDTITETTITGNKYVKIFNSSYKDYHDLPEDKYYQFLNLYLSEIIMNNTLKSGVKEAFEFLHKNNYKIIIITARNNIYTPNAKELTIKFFEQQGLKYDKIIFDDLKTEDKGIPAKENNVDIFIDDKEEVLDKVASVGIKCIRFANTKNSKYQTFNSWLEIIEYLKTK